MKWVRCPKCRTVNDIDRYPMCDGCNADLAGVPVIEASTPSRAQQDGQRDLRAGRSGLPWLAVLAPIGLAGTAFLPPGITILTAIVSFILIFCLIWNILSRGLVRARLGGFATAVLGLGGIIAALIGAFILVAVACSVNLSGIRFGG